MTRFHTDRDRRARLGAWDLPGEALPEGDGMLFTFAEWIHDLDPNQVELCSVEIDFRIVAFRVNRVDPIPPGFLAVFTTAR